MVENLVRMTAAPMVEMLVELLVDLLAVPLAVEKVAL